MTQKIHLTAPHLSGCEKAFIEKAFELNWIGPVGDNVTGFEQDLESFLGANSHVTALNSGTSAIHLALVTLGIKPGDEVICQSSTFIASANPILYLGATPILVDSERDTWNLCPNMLEKAIKDSIKKGKKPKAIIAVCSYGMSYKSKEISDLSKAYNIPIIEDAAEALGSKYFEKKCGSLGDLSALSFNGNKIITTSSGGALICKNQRLKKKITHLANQAKDSEFDFRHSTLGYNYSMSNICAGIGRGQMKIIESRIASRREIFYYYKEKLSLLDNIEFQEEPKGFFSNRWLTCLLTESSAVKEKLLKHLRSKNIDARMTWRPMHRQTLMKPYPKYLNGVADDLYKRGICLPSGTGLKKRELEIVTNEILSCFE